uniref:Uncharacterized protein AlNc14C95G5852 n=1 Tax=Albugo laibachii Nc14 TaxID=890382 RepID=F0WGX6_9STRA|nr:conserved hypothetical protein [Albugo laibachii Nc14]|eukprot:CCA20491.1 conserved hypothetical protein [Albugo laibachii Nc14]
MMHSNATKKWFTKEMVSLLGFQEVEDIVGHVIGNLHTKDQVDIYLSDLCGVPIARIDPISKRLFSRCDSSRQSQGRETAIPPLAMANKRVEGSIKTPKKCDSNTVYGQKINCLRCGKVEVNGGRKCAYCEAKLVYERMDSTTILMVVSKMPAGAWKSAKQRCKQPPSPTQESKCEDIASALEKKLMKEKLHFSVRSKKKSIIVTSFAVVDIHESFA